MGKVRDFFHRIGSDLSKVHVRAAFRDVEHRVAELFRQHPHLNPQEKQVQEEEKQP